MSDIAIRVEHLSKRYRLGEREPYKSLREAIVRAASAPIKRLGDKAGAAIKPEYIWALDDVSFEVRQGEAVGIIGRNGAGKSTLLKVLSRITKPTKGTADIYGRVGSLLEVGTGFHPELTGRENIYLNGAILGMKRQEITRKFDEIVEFAEIEKFLDTPVKRYSSGMYVRLAFAVAAHLEPEILLVDEVLAVGDAEFQKKCLGKMVEVTREGRTVLFVSHNMSSISSLCFKGLLLSHGNLISQGDINKVLKQYSNEQGILTGFNDLRDITPREGMGGAILEECTIYADNSIKPVSGILGGTTLGIQVKFTASDIKDGSYLAIQIYRYDGVPVYAFYSHKNGIALKPNPSMRVIRVEIPDIKLFPSLYVVKLGICDPNDELYDFIDPALFFEVIPKPDTHRSFFNPKSGIAEVNTKWFEVP